MRVFGVTISNIPLWVYIDDSVSGLPAACNSIRRLPADPGASDWALAGITSTTPWQDSQTLLQTCLTSANTRIFTESITDDPRFVVVPRFHQSNPGNNSTTYDVARFEPAYIHAIVTKEGTGGYACTAEIYQVPGDFCRHVPGMDGAITRGGGSGQISSSSALLLKCTHLPSDICSSVSGGGPGGRSFLVTVTLTR